MSAYYNEHDAFAAAWLRELIREKLIADGEVDTRSIVDVSAGDVRGFTQCHFFAGIGGWSYALRLAGWPDDRPVWTGSCPCQPFSMAGAGKGADDPRHLWPTWFRLIAECRPATLFGEQVASKDGLYWLDLVYADLEGAGYAVGAFDLCAAGVGAPHIRQRLWLVADTAGGSSAGVDRVLGAHSMGQSIEGAEPAYRRADGSVEHATSEQMGLSRRARQPRSAASELAHADKERRHEHAECDSQAFPGVAPETSCVDHAGGRGELGDSSGSRLSERERNGRLQRSTVGAQSRQGAECSGFWSDAIWIDCRDGKARPTQPEIFPLASGVSNRVGLLRGAGNSISPPCAQAFIEAYLECTA